MVKNAWTANPARINKSTNPDIDFSRQFVLPKETLPFRRARELDAYVWEKPIEAHAERSHVICGGRDMLMLGGYSYLGLLTNQHVKDKFCEVAAKLGTGSCGVAALSGTSVYHKNVESLISNIWNREQTILYPSGYTANLAVINAITRAGDEIYIDTYAHMSLHDACSQSKAKRVLFDHQDLAGLDMKLSKSRSNKNKLVVVDAVYSMDGNICSLIEVVAICKKHKALLLVDECHAFGMLQPYGFGIEEYYNLPTGTIDLRIGTLSKAIPSAGGFVSCSNELADYIRHHGHHNIFSGSQSAANMAAAETAINLLLDNPEWICALHKKANDFRSYANELGLHTGTSETAIIPIIIDDVDQCILTAAKLFEQGIYIQPVLFPAVKKSRLRVGISVNMSNVELRAAAKKISDVVNSTEVCRLRKTGTSDAFEEKHGGRAPSCRKSHAETDLSVR